MATNQRTEIDQPTVVEPISRPLTVYDHRLQVAHDSGCSASDIHLRTHSMETVCISDSPNLAGDRKPSPGGGGESDSRRAPSVYSLPSTESTPTVDVEPPPYDPHDYCDVDHPTSYSDTVQLLFLLAAGPAILLVPGTFAAVGWILGVVVLAAVVALYAYSMHTIVWSEYVICKQRRVPNLTYAETAYRAFKMGPKSLRWLAPICRLFVLYVSKLVWFGGAHLLYACVSRNVRWLADDLLGVHVDAYVIVPTSIVPLVALFWIPNLKYLVPLAAIANLATVLTVLAVICWIVVDPQPWTPAQRFGSVGEIPFFVGTLLLIIKAAGILLTLKNQMKRPANFDGRYGALAAAYASALFVHVVFALLCALKFGDRLARENVLETMPPNCFVVKPAIVLVTVAFAFQYPLMLYVPFDVIWNVTLRERRKKWRNERACEYALRTALVLLSYALSIGVPSVTLFVWLSGTVGSSLDSFVLPAAVRTLVAWRTNERRRTFYWTLAGNTLVAAVGVALVVCGSVGALVELIHNHGQHDTIV